MAADIGARVDALEKGINSRLDAIETRLGALEGGGGRSRATRRPAARAPKRRKSGDKSKKSSGQVERMRSTNALERLGQKVGAEELAASVQASDERKKRMTSYRFGTRNLYVLKPAEGYPTPEQCKAPVAGDLELAFAYGYNGKDLQSRQNLFLAPTGELIYMLAAVGVVLDPKSGEQKFFFGHNDDITCIAFNPKSGLVATGQVDPKDVPGQGKDLPKIFIWHYQNPGEVVKLIDNASWGQVKKVQWSPRSPYLYSMGGDDNQSISGWHTDDFSKKKMTARMQKDTYREEAFGMLCMETVDKASCIDEIIMFGRRKVSYLYITERKAKGKTILACEVKNVTMSKAQGAPKSPEKAYLSVCRLPGRSEYLVGSPSGYIFMCKGASGLRAFKAHASAIGDIQITEDTSLIVAASFDGTLSCVRIDGTNFKTESQSQKIAISGSDFEMAPRAIAYANKQVYIGTKSNQIVQTGVDGQGTKMVVDGHDDQIWGLATHSKLPLVLTGGWDNCIKLWDKDKRINIETFLFPEVMVDDKPFVEKVQTCAWSDDGALIAAGTEDSKVALWAFDASAPAGSQLKHLETYQIPEKSKNAQREAVDCLRFSADNNLLAVGHMDSNTYIFDISKKKLTQWKGRLKEVAAPSHLCWSADNTMLQVFTRDYEISYWKIDEPAQKFKRITTVPDPDLVKWSGDPLIAGWDVQGLYQADWDGTDLNDATVANNKKLIATGDDYGWVRLHNYPCITNEVCKQYQAHSAFVVGVEWTGDDGSDEYLMTVGGNDYAIFQWRLSNAS